MNSNNYKKFESLKDLCDALNALGRDIEGRDCESCQMLDERTMAHFGFVLESYPVFGDEMTTDLMDGDAYTGVWSYDATHVMISARHDDPNGNWYIVVPRDTM